MKILLVNNFCYNRGGDCTYLFSLKKLLEEKGHKTVVFSMHHPQNFNSEHSEYFVSYINYDEEVKEIDIGSGIKVLNRTIYSKEAGKKIEKLIKVERPDIAHIQNIHHHITPSIFYVLKKYKIPIVWTLHDYTVICPNTSFLAHGRICERCKKRKYFWPLLLRCKKDSLGASTMAAIESTLHHITGIYNLVDVFIAPSEFLNNKFLEYGFKNEKITCLNYFADISCSFSDENKFFGDYYLYIGRISEEKGVKNLIDAFIKICSDNNGSSNMLKKNKLKIVGGGPLKEELELYTKSKDKNGTIEFLGHKSREEVIKVIKGSQVVVVPSEWYENFPFAIIESFACGKPVIGSNLGGIPELIKDTERGLIFEPGNVDDLSSAVKYLLNNPDLVAEMGENARKFVKQELSGEKHYEKLFKIYEQILLKNSNH